MKQFYIICNFLILIAEAVEINTVLRFPDNFLFGAASSSYQIEGAWSENGKGESIWDRGIHEDPTRIRNRSNGDIACNSYHKYRDDVQLLKKLQVNFYRFSISWPRILPNGEIGHINPEGVQYYNDLINELLDNGIQSCVTIYHWDLPQLLQEEGGWTNPDLIDYYIDYANLLFSLFGDRVKYWITFNEIEKICEEGYSRGAMAPYVHNPGVGGYKCAHIVLLAHAKTYRMYDMHYRPNQNGQVGIAIDGSWAVPNDNDSESDQAASELSMQMTFGWFVDPLVFGNYPPVMIERIRSNSIAEGFNTSRLPEFTPVESELIGGTFDFLGVNHYTTYKCCFAAENGTFNRPSNEADVGVTYSQDETWERSASVWLTVVPWGFRKFLMWINTRYGNPPIIVTENGFSDFGDLGDCGRVDYYRKYLYELLKSIHIDKCKVIGYIAWSLLDNFEWASGYSEKFGLYQVDFNDPERRRTPKLSSYIYNNIITTKYINWNYCPVEAASNCSSCNFQI